MNPGEEPRYHERLAGWAHEAAHGDPALMATAPGITVLAPGIISGASLPARWRRRARLRALPARDETGLLAHAFGIDATALAPAPLHYYAVTGRDPGGYCQFACPVHLHARRDHLVLMAGPDFELSDAEAEAIITLLHEYYPDWRIERTRDGMWFIISDDTPQLITTSLKEALGEDINHHLPRGADAMRWHRTFNELQMILSDSAVNRVREAADRPPLNSLWFWGGGSLPALTVPYWRRLVSDDPVALGIARRAGLATHAPGDDPGNVAEPATLHVYTGEPGGETSAPAVSWQRLDRMLRRGELARLTLMEPGHGELCLEARRLRSWLPWR